MRVDWNWRVACVGRPSEQISWSELLQGKPFSKLHNSSILTFEAQNCGAIPKSDCEGFFLKIFCRIRLLIIISSSSSSCHHHHLTIIIIFPLSFSCFSFLIYFRATQKSRKTCPVQPLSGKMRFSDQKVPKTDCFLRFLFLGSNPLRRV